MPMQKPTRAEGLFRSFGPNFMTPDVHEYRDLSDGRMVELSSGEGLDRQRTIYGVSVRHVDGTRCEDGALYWSSADAAAAVDTLEDNGGCAHR